MNQENQKYFWGTCSDKKKHPGYCVHERLGNGVAQTVADNMTQQEAVNLAAELNVGTDPCPGGCGQPRNPLGCSECNAREHFLAFGEIG